MVKIKILIFCLFFLQLTGDLKKSLTNAHPKKIAVCIGATDTTPASIQSLIESGRRYFCRLHEVDYWIVGESDLIMEGDDINWVPTDRGDKPFAIYYSLQAAKKLFEAYDYLFILNAQAIFAAPVSDEIFGDLIAIQKEVSVGKPPLYSSAFFGGKPAAVFNLLKAICRHIDYGLTQARDQRLDEELLINRSFKDCHPTRILNPSYAYPENWKLEYPKKIIITNSLEGSR